MKKFGMMLCLVAACTITAGCGGRTATTESPPPANTNVTDDTNAAAEGESADHEHKEGEEHAEHEETK